jgi:putative transcriptional regulator
MKSLSGHLLVAPPEERDLDFIRTVILLVQHSEEQAFGLILDRPTTKTVKQAWKSKRPCRCTEVVYSGGPVASPLMALHTDQHLAEIEVMPGVYYSVQVKQLEELFRCSRHPFKVFDSHVGWGPGQLESFLEVGPFLVGTDGSLDRLAPRFTLTMLTVTISQVSAKLARTALGFSAAHFPIRAETVARRRRQNRIRLCGRETSNCVGGSAAHGVVSRHSSLAGPLRTGRW